MSRENWIKNVHSCHENLEGPIAFLEKSSRFDTWVNRDWTCICKIRSLMLCGSSLVSLYQRQQKYR